MSDQLCRLLYISVASSANLTTDDFQILKEALRFNSANNVSGFLHRELDHFVQVLEGPAAIVDRLFTAIRNDRRHFNLRCLLHEKVDTRLFEYWDMGYSIETDTSLADFVGKQLENIRPDDHPRLIQHLHNESIRQMKRLGNLSLA